jgi:DNA-binding transcriptional ArsR family regulator
MDNYQGALDPAFQALADATRRAVVQQLAAGEASISQLAAPHAMALPSFMKHIAVLEGAGLVVTRKQGRVRHCRLNAERLAACEAWFAEQRRAWQSRYQNLDSLLTELQTGAQS